MTARLANVQMRSMLLLVQFLSTCNGSEFASIDEPKVITFKEPVEYSCEKVRPSGTSGICKCESGNCTLSVTLGFGEANILYDNSGMVANGQHVDQFDMLGFNLKSPGPTIRVRAGDTLRILLENHLDPELVSTKNVKNNMFREFDVTNLHTHGLHVSPRAPADDIINTSVAAGGKHQYEYHIPVDHMGGTHWYHAHWHGAVSIHVNFGAAGMIIVEDAENQLPMELASVEDYIVAAYHVDFKDINTITNTYIKNCKEYSTPSSCDGIVGCEDFEGAACKTCTDDLCVAQAQKFLAVLPGDNKDYKLLLVNGQHEPTLTITADTWVRLRLGFLATGTIL